MNVTPLRETLFTLTITGPVVVPVGTGVMILLLLQLVGDAIVPLKVTVLGPWSAPKFDPMIVVEVPVKPDGGETAPMTGATAKTIPLLL